MVKKIVSVLLVSSTAVLLTACAGASQANGGMDNSFAEGSGGGLPAAPAEAYQDTAVAASVDGSAEMSGKAGSDLVTGAVVDRQIIRVGNMNVTVESVSKAAAEAKNLTNKYGGYVSSEDSNTNGDENDAYWSLTSQIPSDKLDAYIVDVSALGDVTATNVNAQDVTAVIVDLDARIKALTSSIDRLNELITKSGNVEDLLAVESAISQRQSELDSLVAQRKTLGDQVAMSSVTVFFSAVPVIAPVESDGFSGGFEKGWADFQTSVGKFVTNLGEATPVLLLVVLPGLLILLVIVLVVVRSIRKHSAATVKKDDTAAVE